VIVLLLNGSKKVWIVKTFFVQKVRDIAELILPVDLRTKKRKEI
jgi:hypothetical protein